MEALAGGMAVLLVEGSGQALAFSTQDMPGRSVTNPSGEGNMRGPQDAFTEHLRNNISQLRRRFRTGSFTAEICTANTRAKTEYAICYDTALAPADVVQTLKQRLAGVQIPVLLDSTYFASFLKQDKLNLFPAAAYTERPATACARICEGKIVILVSGSPLAMVVPSFLPSTLNAWTIILPAQCLPVSSACSNIWRFCWRCLGRGCMSWRSALRRS